jgi:hypothetical protein
MHDTSQKIFLFVYVEGRKMTDISRSLQNNSTAQKNTHIDADYLDRQEQGKNIDLKQKVGMRSFGPCIQCVEISYNCLLSKTNRRSFGW